MSIARHWVALPARPGVPGGVGRGHWVRTCPSSARRATGHAAGWGRGSEARTRRRVPWQPPPTGLCRAPHAARGRRSAGARAQRGARARALPDPRARGRGRGRGWKWGRRVLGLGDPGLALPRGGVDEWGPLARWTRTLGFPAAFSRTWRWGFGPALGVRGAPPLRSCGCLASRRDARQVAPAPSSSPGSLGPRLASHPYLRPPSSILRNARLRRARSCCPLPAWAPGEADSRSCPCPDARPALLRADATCRAEAGRLRLCEDAPGLGTLLLLGGKIPHLWLYFLF